MRGGLPANGATTRLHKLNHLAEYCSMFPQGLSRGELIKEGLRLGNRPERVVEYITTRVTMGLLHRVAEKYYVDKLSFLAWAEKEGFRQADQEVQCLDCGCVYSSKEMFCRECESLNRKVYLREELTEAPEHTHIHTHIQTLSGIQELNISRIQLDLPLQANRRNLTHTYTHIKKEASEGRQAEERCVELLGMLGRSWLGPGKNGKPDVFLEVEDRRYAVEVKSLQKMRRSNQGDVNGYKSNDFRINRDSWRALCLYADAQELNPLLMVEVKISGSKKGHLYHLIPREYVDYKVNSTVALFINFSVDDLPALSIQSFRPGLPFLRRCVL